jgi:hypothetical protein
LFSSGTSQCFCQSSASESQDKEAEKVWTTQQCLVLDTETQF